MLSAVCFNLNQSKILSSGNGLMNKCMHHALTDGGLSLYHTIPNFNDPKEKAFRKH